MLSVTQTTQCGKNNAKADDLQKTPEWFHI